MTTIKFGYNDHAMIKAQLRVVVEQHGRVHRTQPHAFQRRRNRLRKFVKLRGRALLREIFILLRTRTSRIAQEIVTATI